MGNTKDRIFEGPQEDFIDYQSIRLEEEYYEWLSEKKARLQRYHDDIDCLMRLVDELDRKRLALIEELKGHV